MGGGFILVRERVPGVLERREVGVGVAHLGAAAPQQLDDVERGRLAQVVDVLLVGDAEDVHARAVHRLALGVERLHHAADHVLGHAAVDLPGQLDEARLEVVLLRLPRQVERVDGDAVAAEAGAGIERHEAERLRLGRVDHLPHVDVHPVAHQRELVHEADVHGAERVLEELDHLGHARGADRHDGVHHLAVERHRHPRAHLVMPAHDLRDVLRLELRVARVHTLGRERQVEVLSGLQPLLLERRPHDLVRRPRIRRGLQNDELALPENTRRRLHGLDHVGQVGVLGLAERRGDTDVDDVHVGQRGRVGRGHEPSSVHDLLQVRDRHVGNVALPGVEPGHSRLVHIEAHHAKARAGKLHGQRQPDIAEADHAEPRLLRFNTLQKFHSHPR